MGATRLLTVSIALAFAALSASTAIAVGFWRRKTRAVEDKIGELEVSLKVAIQKCAAERQGRIRAQQALRKAVAKSNSDDCESTTYPMASIATVRSCFSTRNGTPRQPLIVPLARACLVFDPSRVPPASLEGLEGYSHCWIIYVFHLNTDLEKLWKHPSHSKFKAKVRVPRLKGEKMGVFATRSPHRPCPIGLTVAKVDAVDGNRVLISGVDLVDGSPVLDVKPYLPYCDSIPGAMVPDWVKVDNMLAVASVNFSGEFPARLNDFWSRMEKKSLYTSPGEFQRLIQQVLSWDIRSVSQRSRPHNFLSKTENSNISDDIQSSDYQDYASPEDGSQETPHIPDIVYHLILEGLDISYKIDYEGNVHVEKVDLAFQTEGSQRITAIS